MTMYEVYCAYNEKEIIYIGYGKIGRHKHCISGISHVYNLNKEHFCGRPVQVKVLKYFSTNKEAKEAEKKLISFCKPKYNTLLKVKAISKEPEWAYGVMANKFHLEMLQNAHTESLERILGKHTT